MIRYAFTLLAAMGAVAAAAAFQEAPAATTPHTVQETVIVKNSAFPVLGPVDWVQCNTDDCSDVPNQ